MLAGRFVSVAMGPKFHDYEACPVITLRAEAGYLVHSKSGPVEVIPGAEYTMHLFSQTLYDQFVSLKPEMGELFVTRYVGTRSSGSRVDKDGAPVDYHLFAVMCPDRPIVTAPTLTWDDLSPKGKNTK